MLKQDFILKIRESLTLIDDFLIFKKNELLVLNLEQNILNIHNYLIKLSETDVKNRLALNSCLQGISEQCKSILKHLESFELQQSCEVKLGLMQYLKNVNAYIFDCQKFIWSPPSSPVYAKAFSDVSRAKFNIENINPNIQPL